MLSRIEALERKLNKMNIRGIVDQIDPGMGIGGCVVVRYGDNQLSGWMPVKPIRAGQSCIWWFPDIGEGVTVTDVETGEVLPGSYTSKNPPPTRDPNVLFIKFGNGDHICHNRESGILDIKTDSEVNVKTTEANITADTANIVAKDTNVTSDNVNITASVIKSVGDWSHNGVMSVSGAFSMGGGAVLSGGNFAMSGGSMAHDGVNVGKTHKHSQTADSDGNTQQDVSGPK